MIREYVSPRDYLDELIAQVERRATRHQRAAAGRDDADQRATAELTLAIERADAMIRARCEASAAAGVALPLEQLRLAFGLSATEARLVEVLVALELSAAVRQLVAPHLDRAGQATVELLEALIYGGPRERASAGDELVSDGRLFRLQLAQLGGAELAWLARPVKLAARVVELALGRLRLDPEVARVATLTAEPSRGDALILDAATRALVETALRAQLARGGAPLPFVAGPAGAGRGSLIHAAAHRLGLPVLDVRAGLLPHGAELGGVLTAIAREAKLFGAIVVVRDLELLVADEGRQLPDRVARVAAALELAGTPAAVTATANVWPPSARPIVLAELSPPSELEREVLWRRALGEPGDVAERAAERYRVTAGVIERAAAFARVQATARSGPIVLDDVRVGIRLQLDAELATLGRRVAWQQAWQDVVLPDELRGELDQLIGRIRHRRRVLDDWGFARKLAKGVGVSALFSGPPGTGKTMVAGLVARELELDLYLIDASRLVSKWIGETEKNLARLFDAAAAGHAALLFDEADSLFARRTEVKSSSDRYANLEVNYLLQRMEAFEGVTILTTNFESSIDDAFKRRLAFRIAFAMPEVAERQQLWRAMLPAQAAIEGDIDFAALADRFAMSGGYIRNAVVRAAYLAATEGRSIAMRHLQRGATQEYAAMGMVIQHGAGS